MPDVNRSLLFDTAVIKIEATLPRSANASKLMAFVGPAADAVVAAINLWRRQAMLMAVTVSGPTAMGGVVVAAPVEPSITAKLVTADKAMTAALAKGLGGQWTSLQAAIRVPSLVWYPSFASVNGPFAPPMPNTPSPLSSLCAQGMTFIAEKQLATAFAAKLTAGVPIGTKETLAGLAAGIAQALTLFIQTTKVTNVMASGQAAGFSPFSPISPVTNGVAIMMAGGLV